MSGPEFVSPMCCREKDAGISLLRNQLGFFNFVCLPFYNACANALPPSKTVGADRCQANFEMWEKKLAEATVGEKQAPPAAAFSPEAAVRAAAFSPEAAV